MLTARTAQAAYAPCGKRMGRTNFTNSLKILRFFPQALANCPPSMLQYSVKEALVCPKNDTAFRRRRRISMKKLLTLVLALAIITVPFSLAESDAEEIEVKAVEDSIAGLQYNLPVDWIVMSSASIETILTAVAEIEEVQALVSDEVLAQMQALTQNGMSISMSADMLSNVSIIASPASGVTTQMLYDSQEVLLDSYRAQIKQGLELANEVDWVTYDEREFLLLQATMFTQNTDIYLFVENDVMYTITFTNVTNEIEEILLTSIEVAAPAEEEPAIEEAPSAE